MKYICRMVLLPMQYMLTATQRSACYLWVVCRGQTTLDSKTPQEFLIELVVKLLNTFGWLSRCVGQIHVHEDL